MENIAPPLELLMEVRFQIEKGLPVKNGILSYINQNRKDPWRQFLLVWLKEIEQNRKFEIDSSKVSLQRKHCLMVLGRGLVGESIHPQICNLEEELFRSATAEVEEYIATLPIKSLIPLLFFQFPALLMMILGPLLSSFFAQ